MPEPIYPPPPGDTGALTIPRQLNRWLDVNPQGGALTRARKFVQLPVFTAEDSWDGYSQIVTSFNYEADHNFSLKPFQVPNNPNYVLCISYRVGLVVTRYLLWDAIGSNIWFVITPYTGQVILKNFRLEVWDTSQGACSNAAALTFDTSVLANRDYRWVDDSALTVPGPQVTNFWYQATQPTPLDDLGLVLTRFKATSGITDSVGWLSTDGIDNALSASIAAGTATSHYNTWPAALVGANAANGTAQGTVNNLFVLFQYKPYTGGDLDEVLVHYNNSYSVHCGIESGDNYISVNGTKLTQSQFLVADEYYLLACIAGAVAILVRIYDRVATIPTDIAVSIGISTSVQLQGGSSKFPLLEVTPMYNVTDYQAMYQYFFLTYGGKFVMPLVMPPNSVSVTN